MGNLIQNTELFTAIVPSPCVIRKVREEFGILGNMSKHEIEYGDIEWPTSEHLFQALRFSSNSEIRELLLKEKNPLQAKWKVKARRHEMTVEPLSNQDLENMRLVLRLKLDQHPRTVGKVLASTKGRTIVEDCSNRQQGSGLFWGAAFSEGLWSGKNWLGRLWMELRDE